MEEFRTIQAQINRVERSFSSVLAHLAGEAQYRTTYISEYCQSIEENKQPQICDRELEAHITAYRVCIDTLKIYEKTFGSAQYSILIKSADILETKLSSCRGTGKSTSSQPML